MTNRTENFIAQYEQELFTQEINASKRILNGFIWFLGAVALVWLLTLIGLLPLDKNLVTCAFFASFILFLPAFYLIFRGDLTKKWVKYLLLTLLCIACGVITSVLSFYATLLFVFPLIYATQYRERRIIWFTYLINLLTITTGLLISCYYGLFSTRLLFGIIPSAIILFILAMMLQYTVISNTRDALRIAQLTYYKDTDTNTKVFNKNKYEEMITKYYPGVDRLAVIFFDLNNLKTINDKLGHATGDFVIEKLASFVKEQSDHSRRVYRVGGDEFVMIIERPSPGDAELIIANVKEAIYFHNQSGAVTISTAAGFAYGKGSNVLEVVKEADEKMYENKNLIKEQTAQ